ncbi:Ribonuclease III [Candidatus Trichorickettsia mobilis]|uniref:Ribonuclease 3 n=1 Tax=Candidatus Trichorickettsia mobilis TaxID=1346319 RepID=A0ABZ0USL2_9RICK|nr:ribonuclease III [Candidatus Trichorickettsia mobilis]WPY01020.1 Ribonuclease III [Candidatus Trichorickettsia mobilis]
MINETAVIQTISKRIEQSTGYHFNNLELLVESLSHPSLKQNISKYSINKNYERLELLGDAILNFIITEYLFQNFTKQDEGTLARVRSFLVCKETLCKVAAAINLADDIIMTHGEEISGGRSNPNNLENAMEALIAAIYLDSNIDTIRSIIINLWSEFLNNINISKTDPKTTLQEWAQSKGYNKPIYTVVNKSGYAHSPYFTIMAKVAHYQQQGHGNSIKTAEKEAAQKILDILKL